MTHPLGRLHSSRRFSSFTGSLEELIEWLDKANPSAWLSSLLRLLLKPPTIPKHVHYETTPIALISTTRRRRRLVLRDLERSSRAPQRIAYRDVSKIEPLDLLEASRARQRPHMQLRTGVHLFDHLHLLSHDLEKLARLLFLFFALYLFFRFSSTLIAQVRRSLHRPPSTNTL